MPVYEFRCTKCGDEFEETLPIEDRDIPAERPCGCCFQDKSVKRIWYPTAAHFKGEGFYATDK